MKKLVIAGLLALAPVLAAAQGTGDKPVIKLIVKSAEPLPTNHPLAPDALANAVGKILSDRGYRWERLQSERMAAGDTALRILYIVSEQSEAGGGPVVAASAATALLQRARLEQSTLTLSVYNGIQQSLGQEPATDAARAEVYTALVDELRDGIGEALRHLEYQ